MQNNEICLGGAGVGPPYFEQLLSVHPTLLAHIETQLLRLNKVQLPASEDNLM